MAGFPDLGIRAGFVAFAGTEASDVLTFGPNYSAGPIMPRYLGSIAFFFCIFLGSFAANGQSRSQNEEWCANKDKQFSPDQQISGCTAIIQSGKESKNSLSNAFWNRGNAWLSKGQFDTAIENYDEAVKLNPNSAVAYHNRGIAYRERGLWFNSFSDGVKALEDFGRAQQAIAREGGVEAQPQGRASPGAAREGAAGKQKATEPPRPAASSSTPAKPASTPADRRPIEVRDDNGVRETVKTGKGMIIVQITSFDPACRPCIDANRVFDLLSSKHAARARFVRVHYEPLSAVSNSSLASEFKLQSVPTLLVFQDGREQRRILGHQPEPILEKSLFGDGEPVPLERKGKAEAPAAASPASERPKPREAAIAYLGCFRDQGNPWSKEGRDLDGARWDDSAMTNARCVGFCRSQNFAYAATQYGVACFCGNSYGRVGRADNCDMPCAGNAKENCGGSWANSVWRIGSNLSAAPSPPSAAGIDAGPTKAETLQAFNGVWGTSLALCDRYVAHIADAKNLNGALDFFASQGGASYFITSQGVRMLDEASTTCRVIGSTARQNGISAALRCTNAVNPDVSTNILEIVKSEIGHRFIWKDQYGGTREQASYQCMTMNELSQKLARLWRFESTKCAAVTAYSGGNVTFSKDPAGNLMIAVFGESTADYKRDFPATIAIDHAQPIDVTARTNPAGFSASLGPLESHARLVAEGFMLSIWTKETASRDSGAYRVPIMEMPLLGSGRAMDFLRQCRIAESGDSPPPNSDQVQTFLKSFVAQLDRELPGYAHKIPDYRLIDLNDDGRGDIVLRPISPLYCGSAGCTLFVYRGLPDGQFEYVYEKQSPDESFPTVGPVTKDGYRTLMFPYHSIGDGRTLAQVAEWQGAKYVLSHFVDGEIRITPLNEKEKGAINTDGVLRELPSTTARSIEPQGLGFNLGTTVNGEGRWLVSKSCVSCRYGYAKIRE